MSIGKIGRVRVDFAGTRLEAQDFTKVHKTAFLPGRLGVSPEKGEENHELPMVSCVFNGARALEKAQKEFERLGWDKDSQIIEFNY